ncbi:MAG: hypothetical protein E7099_06250 [Mediterranea massiliensis]|nr:hypothetical protein [Mediterranea massiliensis]
MDKNKKRKLSKSQIICIVLLWASLCYMVLTGAERIDGPTIVTLLLASAFILLPIYKNPKKE